MSLKSTIQGLATILVLLLAHETQAQTAKQWEDLGMKDAQYSQAVKMVYASEEITRPKLIAELNGQGNQARANLVQRIPFDFDEITGRILLEASQHPDMQLNEIVRQWLLDFSLPDAQNRSISNINRLVAPRTYKLDTYTRDQGREVYEYFLSVNTFDVTLEEIASVTYEVSGLSSNPVSSSDAQSGFTVHYRSDSCAQAARVTISPKKAERHGGWIDFETCNARGATAADYKELGVEYPLTTRSNRQAALLSLTFEYSVLQRRAVEHYRSMGNEPRAAIVEHLQPNMDEIIGRAILASRSLPNAKVGEVIQGYIIDVSAELLKKQSQ